MPDDRAGAVTAGQPVALVDLLDRLLAGGIVLHGELVLSIADVDLVRVSLRALVASVGATMEPLSEPSPCPGQTASATKVPG